MPSAKKTPNYGLNQWEPNEHPKREDFVNDNAIIDEALKENSDAAANAAAAAENAKNTANAAIPKSMATGADQVLVSTGAGTWAAKTLAQFKTWLALKAENISDFADKVRSTVLTGLSTATNAVITASDTVLSALGKLQAQITAHAGNKNNPHNVTASQVGAYSKTESVSDATKALYGLGADAVPDDVFAKLAVSALPWGLLESFTTPGALDWTVPDIYGDGRPYEIGVFIIGAGGSGAASHHSGDSYGPQGRASGGASGYTRSLVRTVTPGETIPVVVGAGGRSVTYSMRGEAGGSSSFDGTVAEGGAGGILSTGTGSSALPAGANGGQGSDACSISMPLTAPAMGRTTTDALSGNNFFAGGVTFPSMSLNPFDGKRYLGAGGGVYNASVVQTCPMLDDGNKAGDAAYGTSGVVVAQDATGYGNGGGAAGAANSADGVRSGKGSDGAVLVYVRGYSE